VANWITSHGGGGTLGYDMLNCLKGAKEEEKYDAGAFQFSQAVRVAMQKTTSDRPAPKDALKTNSMMCSEFAVACYQGCTSVESTLPYIEVQAKHVLPPQLEQWLIKNPDKFKVVGVLGHVPGRCPEEDLEKATSRFYTLGPETQREKEPVLDCLRGFEGDTLGETIRLFALAIKVSTSADVIAELNKAMQDCKLKTFKKEATKKKGKSPKNEDEKEVTKKDKSTKKKKPK
jgi:hypothetical protein